MIVQASCLDLNYPHGHCIHGHLNDCRTIEECGWPGQGVVPLATIQGSIFNALSEKQAAGLQCVACGTVFNITIRSVPAGRSEAGDQVFMCESCVPVYTDDERIANALRYYISRISWGLNVPNSAQEKAEYERLLSQYQKGV